MVRNFLIILILSVLFSCSRSENSSPDNPTPTPPITEDIFTTLGQLGIKYGFQTAVPKQTYNIILGNTSSTSVVMNIMPYDNYTGFVSYGLDDSSLTTISNFQLEKGKPYSLPISNLIPDKEYIYYFSYKASSGSTFTKSSKFTFRTKKSESQTFSFAVIADSHIDLNSDTLTYRNTLKNIANQNNDFLVDLGDTFMTDKYGSTYTDALGQYVAQRYYFGSVCNKLPLYFTVGNHDGEIGDKNSAMTSWSLAQRKLYYPVLSSQNYYSWEWGNALFVVLDPFTNTPAQGGNDAWLRTLGKTQYDWLNQTLSTSTKKFKFVFIHNLVGGVDADGQARGGAESAPYFEWGGKNLLGVDEFSSKRSGWQMPIHNLLKKYNVDIVFHGHDHVYAKQNYDGIIYQCVQQPSLKRFENLSYATTYGYNLGIINYIPGNLKLTISPNQAKIESISYNNILIDSYIINK